MFLAPSTSAVSLSSALRCRPSVATLEEAAAAPAAQLRTHQLYAGIRLPLLHMLLLGVLLLGMLMMNLLLLPPLLLFHLLLFELPPLHTQVLQEQPSHSQL